MWGIDDPTAPHAPATNLPDARLNVLHVTIWYVIQLILWARHTLTFMTKKNKKKLSVHTVYSLLFTPASDCLDPGPDLHPVGPDRVQTVCFGFLQTTNVTAGRTIRTVWTASKLSLISQNCLTNCLHPDQGRQYVGPDRDSNCLPRLSSREPGISYIYNNRVCIVYCHLSDSQQPKWFGNDY